MISKHMTVRVYTFSTLCNCYLFLTERVVRKSSAKEKAAVELRDDTVSGGDNLCYNQCYIGNMLYNGRLIPARDTAACFMIFNSDSQRFREIPPTLRVCVGFSVMQWLSEGLILLVQLSKFNKKPSWD